MNHNPPPEWARKKTAKITRAHHAVHELLPVATQRSDGSYRRRRKWVRRGLVS